MRKLFTLSREGLLLILPSHARAQSFVAACENANNTGTTVASLSCSASLNVSAGQTLMVYCKANAGTVNDTGGDTFVAGTVQTVTGIGKTQVFYVLSAAANSADIPKCSFSVNEAFNSIIAYQMSGASTAKDAGITATNCTSSCSATITSSAFSTVVAHEIIVACASFDDGSSETWSAGSVGGTTAGNLTTSAASNADSACEDRVVTTTQSSITAAMGLSGSVFDTSITIVSFEQAGGAAITGFDKQRRLEVLEPPSPVGAL